MITIKLLSRSFLLLLLLAFSGGAQAANPFAKYCKRAFSKDAFYHNLYNNAVKKFSSEESMSQESFELIKQGPEAFIAFLDVQRNKVGSEEALFKKDDQASLNKMKKKLNAYLKGDETSSYQYQRAFEVAAEMLDTGRLGVFKSLFSLKIPKFKTRDHNYLMQKQIESLGAETLKIHRELFRENTRWEEVKRKFALTAAHRDVFYSLSIYVSTMFFAKDFAEALEVPLSLVFLPVVLPHAKVLFDRVYNKSGNEQYLKIKDFLSKRSLGKEEFVKSVYVFTTISLIGYFSIVHDFAAKQNNALKEFHLMKTETDIRLEKERAMEVEELAVKRTEDQILLFEREYNMKIEKGSSEYLHMLENNRQIVKVEKAEFEKQQEQ